MTHCPHCKKPFENGASPKGCRVLCYGCDHVVWPPEFGIAPQKMLRLSTMTPAEREAFER